MAFNQDAIVTSSEDGVTDSPPGSTAISDVSEKKPCRLTVMTPLKMVAKVLPTVRKEEEKPNVEEFPESQEKLKVAKKQVFPWLVKFNALCREAAGSHNYNKLDDLMDIYIRCVSKDVMSCYRRTNRAAKLKIRMNDYMKLFQMLDADIRRPLDHNMHYLHKMSEILAMYLDMEIKASRRGKEYPRTVSDRLMSALFILLENSIPHILNAILNAKLFMKKFHEVCIPIIKRAVRDIPASLDDATYIQYILVFRKWKMIVKKSERMKIKSLAAVKLWPSPELYYEYYNSHKYQDLLPTIKEVEIEEFTFALMNAPGPYNKNTTVNAIELYESPGKILKDIQLDRQLLFEEDYCLLTTCNSKRSKRTIACYKEVWDYLDELVPSSEFEVGPLDILFEEEFISDIRKRQAAEEKRKLEIQANRVLIVKDTKTLPRKSTQSSLGNQRSVTKYNDKFGYATSTSNAEKTKKSNTSGRGVKKREADSQSQDEIIVIDDDDDIVIKEEPKDEDSGYQETVSMPALAVVRPENVDQIISEESSKKGNNEEEQEEQLITSENMEEKLETNVEEEVTTTEQNENNDQVEESCVSESTCEVVASVPPVEAYQSFLSKQMVEEVLQQEFTETQGDSQSMNYISYEDQTFNMFDSEDFYSPLCFSNWSADIDNMMSPLRDCVLSQPNEKQFGHALMNLSPDHDIMLSQTVAPSIMELWEGAANLESPSWEFETMMTNSVPYQEEESPEPEATPPPAEEEGPKVTFIERRKGKSKTKTKAKELSPHREKIDQVVEKKCKAKPAEVSKKTKPGQRRKRMRFVSDDEEEVEEEPVVEPEPKKKKGGRKRKAPEPPPSPPSLPPSPPPINTRKSRRGSQQSSSVTKKKAQSRRR